MKVGDLVHWNNKDMGLIVDIDPLRANSMKEYEKIGEIVVLRGDGGLWYTNPEGWAVISEDR